MNIERNIREVEEPDGSEFETTDEHVHVESDQPSPLIRIIQFVLATVLIGIVVHGLLTRADERAAQPTANNAAAAIGNEQTGKMTAAAQGGVPAATARPATVMTPPVIAPDNGLSSLYDVRDYLQLARVRRETRAYELGLTSRDALMQMALTADSNR